MEKYNIEFANFVCKFKDDVNFLDRFDEVIAPAFASKKRERQYADTKYFFDDTMVTDITFGDVTQRVLRGRIIKDTFLKREQDYIDGKLIYDPKELHSCPSSYFVVILENHRLIYMSETSDAPNIGAFQTTCAKFINDANDEYIRAERDFNHHQHRVNKHIKRKTLGEIEDELGMATVRVTPLTMPGALAEQLESFSVIRSLSIRILPTNNEELNNDDFFKELDSNARILNSKPKVSYGKKDDSGLDDNGVAEHAEAATKLGNAGFQINGLGPSKEKLKITENDVGVKLQIAGQPPESDVEKAKIGLTEFSKAVAEEIVAVPAPTEAARGRVRGIGERKL